MPVARHRLFSHICFRKCDDYSLTRMQSPQDTVRKRVFVGIDGTTNNAVHAEPTEKINVTNIAKFAQCLRARGDDGIPQTVYYHKGPVDEKRVLGMSRNTTTVLQTICLSWIDVFECIADAYYFIAWNHQVPDDELYFVGFSRGGFAVRTLIAFISDVGILHRSYLHMYPHLFKMWEDFRRRSDAVKPGNAAPDDNKKLNFFKHLVGSFFLKGWLKRDATLQICDVFDTVCAINNRFPALWSRFKGGRLGWESTRVQWDRSQISEGLQCALQALALNEERQDFRPELWNDVELSSKTNVTQCWFRGDHSDSEYYRILRMCTHTRVCCFSWRRPL